jgi:hypothetical protein
MCCEVVHPNVFALASPLLGAICSEAGKDAGIGCARRRRWLRGRRQLERGQYAVDNPMFIFGRTIYSLYIYIYILSYHNYKMAL